MTVREENMASVHEEKSARFYLYMEDSILWHKHLEVRASGSVITVIEDNEPMILPPF